MARAITFQRSLFWNQTGNIVILLLLFLAVAVVNIDYAEERLASELTERAVADTRTSVDRFFEPVAALVLMSAGYLAEVDADLDDPESLDRYFMPLLATIPQVSGVTLGRQDGSSYTLKRTDSGRERRLSDPDRSPGRVLVSRWTEPDPVPVSKRENVTYDARTRPWFTGAISDPPPTGGEPGSMADSVHWTRPYEFPLPPGQHGVTASLAYESPSGSIDVISLDVLLRDVSTFTMDLELKESGSVAVFFDDGGGELALVGLPAGLSETPEKALEDFLLAPPSAIGGPFLDYVQATPVTSVDGQLEPRRFESDGAQWWGAGARVRSGSSVNLLILAIVPQDELVGELRRLALWVLATTVLLGFVHVWRSSRLSRQYARSLEELVSQTERMAGLNFEEGGEVRTRIEEVRMLAQAQEQLRRSLQALSSRQDDVLIARSLRAEQKLVSDVVPLGFELALLDQPTEVVGGSTFAAARHPDSKARVSLLLAVVPGEGVTTAYEGGRVRSVFRAGVRLGTTLEDQVRQIHSHLSRRPELQGPLAMCVAEIDGPEGTIALLTEGGCPVVHFASATGQFHWIPESPTPARVVLEDGDVLLLLTESVLRVLSPERAVFGRERLEDLVRENSAEHAEALAASIGAALDEFAGGRSPERDRTLLVLRRVGMRPTRPPAG